MLKTFEFVLTLITLKQKPHLFVKKWGQLFSIDTPFLRLPTRKGIKVGGSGYFIPPLFISLSLYLCKLKKKGAHRLQIVLILPHFSSNPYQ